MWSPATSSNSKKRPQQQQQQQQFSDTVVLPKEQQQPQRLELSSLPDEMLVRIGTSVAKLCGIRDFVALSMASNRWKRLLIDSEATVSKVICIRTTTSATTKSATTTSATTTTPSASNTGSSVMPPPQIRTLEQLDFYESVVKHGFFRENRVHFEFADLKVADGYSIALIHSTRRLLKRYPSATVVLEAHCGTPAPAEISWLYSHYRGRVVSTAIARGKEVLSLDPLLDDDDDAADSTTSMDADLLQGRVSIRAWGKMITQVLAAQQQSTTNNNNKQQQHLHDHYGALAREGRGWVEIFLRMEDEDTTTTMELPSRPGFYNLIPAMPREYQLEGTTR